jgi:Tol biopolymer transport system component
MNADGTGVTPLGHHPGVLELARWLPDGRIVFLAHRGDGGPLLGTMDASTGAEERFWCGASEGDWHPSGMYVAISAPLRRNGALNWYIFEVELSDRQRRQITFGEHVIDSAPRYSPDGEWIVFTSSSRSPTDSSVWLVRRDGTGMYCLPLGDGWDTEESDADFSPDGQYLAFARGEYEATDLYICRIDGTGLRRLTNFYPDGQAKGQSTLRKAKANPAPKAQARAATPAKPAKPATSVKPTKKQQKRAERAPIP